jgi:broad specificity phosphatase PhoE
MVRCYEYVLLVVLALSNLAHGASMLSQKRVLLLRHGRTEMNDYLNAVPYDSPGFVDPMLVDTRLTEIGRAQAADAAHTLSARVDIELVVCSPLTRALATAELAFARRGGAPLPVVVHPLCAERRWHGADLGRERSALEREFAGAHIDWSLVPAQGGWGYTPHPPPKRGPIVEETEGDFIARLAAFCEWLDTRPESTIAVTTHWGVIVALTGQQVDNCALLEREFAELAPGAHLLEAVVAAAGQASV